MCAGCGREPVSGAGASGTEESGHWRRSDRAIAERVMERGAPRVGLALLWGCTLVAAVAAQGKEGECECDRGPTPGTGTPAPSRAPRTAARVLRRPTWRFPVPVRRSREGARVAIGANLEQPPHRSTTTGVRSSGD